MFASIRDTRGQGNQALYVRARNVTGKFWNFSSRAWVATDTDFATRVFLVEIQDEDLLQSRYQGTVVLPPGEGVLEYVRDSDNLVIGEESFSVPVPVVVPPVPTPGTDLPSPVHPRLPVPSTARSESADLPRANIDLEDFINQVRLFMRDYAELNRLVSGVESSNRQIVWAIMDALDDFNTEPPFTHFSVIDFPSKSVLVRLTVVSLLESIGLLQTRNHLSFSDGGIQVGLNDKTPFIQSWIQLLRTRVDEKAKRIKIAYNIESAWGGGIHSELRFVNNFYGEW